MYAIRRIAGYSAGRYMAVGLINTTPDVAQAHTFEDKRDAELMCQSKYEQVVYIGGLITSSFQSE